MSENENEILQEIRQIREDHARECNFDVHTMFDRMRAETEQLKADGWKVVSHDAPCEPFATLCEDPPK